MDGFDVNFCGSNYCADNLAGISCFHVYVIRWSRDIQIYTAVSRITHVIHFLFMTFDRLSTVLGSDGWQEHCWWNSERSFHCSSLSSSLHCLHNLSVSRLHSIGSSGNPVLAKQRSNTSRQFPRQQPFRPHTIIFIQLLYVLRLANFLSFLSVNLKWCSENSKADNKLR